MIPPGEAPELRFVIPPASVNKIFADETFWFGFRDEAENTDDPVVSIPSVGRPPLEVRFDGPPSYTAGGTLEIALEVENKGSRDNRLKAVRIVAGANPTGEAVYETTLERPVAAGQTVPVRLPIPAGRAHELTGTVLFVDDAREPWERALEPGEPIPVGPVQRPPVVLAGNPYHLDPEGDVLLPKDLGEDGKRGALRLPVSTLKPGQGQVSFVIIRLAPGQPTIEVGFAEPVFVTEREQVIEIPMARADLLRLLSSREATVAFRESAEGAGPAGPGRTLLIPSERSVRLESDDFETDTLGRAVLAARDMKLTVTVTNDRPALPVSPLYLLVASDPEGSTEKMEFPWSELRPGIEALWDDNAATSVELPFDLAARNRLMGGDRLYLWLTTGPDPEDVLASYEVPLPKKTPLRPRAASVPFSPAGQGFLSIDLINDGVMPVRFTGIELRGLEDDGGPGPLLAPEEIPTVIPAGLGRAESVRLVVTPDMIQRLAKRADKVTTVKGALLDETETNSPADLDAETTQLALVRDRLRIEKVTPQKLAGADETLFVKIDGSVRRDSTIGGEEQGASRNIQDLAIEVRLGRGIDDLLYSGDALVSVDPGTGAFNLLSKTENFSGDPGILRIELVSTITNDKSAQVPVAGDWTDGFRTNPIRVFAVAVLAIGLFFGSVRFRSGRSLATQVAEGFYQEMAMPYARILLWGPPGSVGGIFVGYLISQKLFPYDLSIHIGFMIALALTMTAMALTIVVPWSTKRARRWAKRRADGKKNIEPLQIYQSYAYSLAVAIAAGCMVLILLGAHVLLVPLTASPDIPLVEMKLVEPPVLTGP